MVVGRYPVTNYKHSLNLVYSNDFINCFVSFVFHFMMSESFFGEFDLYSRETFCGTTCLRIWIAITIDLKYRMQNVISWFATPIRFCGWTGTYGTINIFAPLLLHDTSMWLPVVSPLQSCWQWDSRGTDYFSKFGDAWKFNG